MRPAIILLLLAQGCHSAMVSSGLDAPDAGELGSKSGFAWKVDSIGRLRLYSESSDETGVTPERVSRALAYVDSALQLTPDIRPINVFIVGSQDRMKAIFGRAVDGRSFYQTGVAALVATPNWEATAKHELTHVVLGQHWGKASSQWISEGIATWIGNPFYGRDIKMLARDRLFRTGKLIPLQELNESFDDESDEVTYLQSASIAQFVARRFGLDLLRQIWQNGIQAIPKATGLSIEAFDREWRQYLGRDEFSRI